jgi:uncharacterized membrane protein
METIQRSIDVARPLSTVYNQWTQFEEFPRFMEGVEEVRQFDDTHVRWTAEIAGAKRTWEAQIVRQVPDESISWRGFGQADNTGTVSFEALDSGRTRVTVRIAWEPEGAVESVADALGLIERRIEGDLDRFKAFIEGRGGESGAWRGEVVAAPGTPADAAHSETPAKAVQTPSE